MRVAVIVNPISGRSVRYRTTGSARQDSARAWLSGRSIDAEVAVTVAEGHGAELARDFAARGFDRIVAWGGDGTVNEVAGPIIGSRVVLGVVRAGSGDGLARGLGLPAAPEHALAAALGTSVIRLDVGWVGHRHFLNTAGFGFDAAVADTFNHQRVRGLAGYLFGGLGCAWSYRSAEYRLELDGTVSSGERFLIAFANGRQYGNGFVLAPDADPTDGMLDVVEVSRGSLVRQLWRARRLFMAPDRPTEGVLRSRAREATVSGSSLLAHVDGEVFEPGGPVRVRTAPGAIAIAAPPIGSKRSAGE